MIQDGTGKELTAWPTIDELETIENYVYASAKASLATIIEKAKKITGSVSPELKVVIFATDYRSDSKVSHWQSADVCFSRTGVANVGTHSANYEPKVRDLHIREDAIIHDLNNKPDMDKRLLADNRRAHHYTDSTGDGWVTADIHINDKKEDVLPTYSLLTASDFYPLVEQRELTDWEYESKNNPDHPNHVERENLSFYVRPDALSETRLAPNVNLPVFKQGKSTTITAIVTLPISNKFTRPAITPSSDSIKRLNFLPDAASGIFAPGWCVSLDKTNDTPYLAAYELGSPFPEVAKLCAALSGFWPAVAPDANRSYFRGEVLSVQQEGPGGTIIPMADQELNGTNSWSDLLIS